MFQYICDSNTDHCPLSLYFFIVGLSQIFKKLIREAFSRINTVHINRYIYKLDRW